MSHIFPSLSANSKFERGQKDNHIRQLKHDAVPFPSHEPSQKHVNCYCEWVELCEKNLYVTGVPGNGKTTFLTWCYHGLVDLDLDVRYFEALDLSRNYFRLLANHQSPDPFINTLIDAGCLIIDDLGTEANNDLIFTNVIYTVIHARLAKKPFRPTLISSNLLMSKLDEHYSKSNPNLSERLVSRMNDTLVELKFGDESHRSPATQVE